jgi:hypothetical protein
MGLIESMIEESNKNSYSYNQYTLDSILDEFIKELPKDTTYFKEDIKSFFKIILSSNYA